MHIQKKKKADVTVASSQSLDKINVTKWSFVCNNGNTSIRFLGRLTEDGSIVKVVWSASAKVMASFRKKRKK